MSNQVYGGDLLRAVFVLDWNNLLRYLSGDYHQFLQEAPSTTVSVNYELPHNEFIVVVPSEQISPENLTASIDRAAELVASMPESARKMLLAPIQHGLLDLESVFYLKDAAKNEHIAICVEDFLRLLSCYFVSNVDMQDGVSISASEALDNELSDSEVPARLLYALSRILDGEYTSVVDGSSLSGYSTLTHFNSIASISSSSLSFCHPSLPSSHPPSKPTTPLESIAGSITERTSSVSSQPFKEQLSKSCGLKVAIAIFFVLLLTIATAVAVYKVLSDNKNGNIALSVNYISQSSLFYISNGFNSPQFKFDHINRLAIVSSVSDSSMSVFTHNFAQSTEWPTNINLTERFLRCETVAFIAYEMLYCCCDETKIWCHGPDKFGDFVDYTHALPYDCMSLKFVSFLYYGELPVLYNLNLIRNENHSNATSYTLTFHPNDTRNLSDSNVINIQKQEIEAGDYFATTQLQSYDGLSLNLLVKTVENEATVVHKMCNYRIALNDSSQPLNFSDCIELAGLSTFIANSQTNAATIRLVKVSGRRLWIVGLYSDTDSLEDSRSTTQETHASEPTLLVYDSNGNLLLSALYGKGIIPQGLEGFEQSGGPRIGYVDENWDYCMFLFMRNKSKGTAVILQFELAFRNI